MGLPPPRVQAWKLFGHHGEKGLRCHSCLGERRKPERRVSFEFCSHPHCQSPISQESLSRLSRALLGRERGSELPFLNHLGLDLRDP